MFAGSSYPSTLSVPLQYEKKSQILRKQIFSASDSLDYIRFSVVLTIWQGQITAALETWYLQVNSFIGVSTKVLAFEFRN